MSNWRFKGWSTSMRGNCNNAQLSMHYGFITQSRNSLEFLPYGITNDRNFGFNQPFRVPTDALLLTPLYIHPYGYSPSGLPQLSHLTPGPKMGNEKRLTASLILNSIYPHPPLRTFVPTCRPACRLLVIGDKQSLDARLLECGPGLGSQAQC